MPTDLSKILDSIGNSIDHLTEAQKNLVAGHEKLLDSQVTLAQQIAAVTDRMGVLTEAVQTLTQIVSATLPGPEQHGK